MSQICINVLYLFFSFWLTSLCVKDSRSIHISRVNRRYVAASLLSHVWPTRLCCPWGFSRQEYWSGFLQGIFPTQGLNPDIPHCRQILYCLNHEGSPSILEWVAYPFSSGSSWPMNRTRVSCIADGFLTSWATRYSNSKNGSDTQTSPGAREMDKIIWNKWVTISGLWRMNMQLFITQVCVCWNVCFHGGSEGSLMWEPIED